MILCILINVLIFANTKTLSEENKRYIIKYISEISLIPLGYDMIHVYFLQSIRCKGCATHSFEYIVNYDTSNLRKYIIIPNNNIDSVILSQLEQLKNVSFIKDAKNEYLKYGLIFSNDLLLKIKEDKIKDYVFINDKNLKKLKSVLNE